MGVHFASKVMNIPAPLISFIRRSQLPNPEITAMYLPESKSILFNEDWVIHRNELEVMATCLHECRHAYQHYCVLTKSREDEATRTQWAKEFTVYFQPNWDKSQEVDVDYLYQSIEVDAIIFTHHQMMNLFQVKTVIPDVIKHRKGESS